jgi:8-amino-7-oxononanoate synthase
MSAGLSSTGIAIVGMACRFPGAEDLPSYWRLLKEGRHAFVTPPSNRWSHEAFFSSSHRTMDKYYVPTGGFLSDVRHFAALEFGIPPRRVEVMDPQQRLSLVASADAMIDAGYEPHAGGTPRASAALRSFNRRKTGVFLGLSCTEYKSLMSSRAMAGMMASGDLGTGADAALGAALGSSVSKVVPSRPFSAAGALGNMSAACVAQELDLGGAAFTSDAACASALVAIHDAVLWLKEGRLDMALAGGVYLNLTPENLIAFSRIGAISAAGVCRPFDARADGFVQGEGVGMVLLKRLEDAIAAGDRIYAVITGSACNNDGHGDGPMAPRLEGQLEVIREAWQEAGLYADQLGLVEAHGTGTSVGDKTELTALREALQQLQNPIPLGSAKANIGHTMSAAGVAGLIKAALSIHHRSIPPLANWSAPHPDHSLEDGFFRIPTVLEPWSSTTPRKATVSSFGFGGTNGHCVLEEASPPRSARAGWTSRLDAGPGLPSSSLLVTTSADTSGLLIEHCRNLLASLPDQLSLGAVAATLNRLPVRKVRLAMVVSSLKELEERLLKIIQALSSNPNFQGGIGLDCAIGTPDTAAPICFLCPGQGSQRVGLLREWLALPAFAGVFQKLDLELAGILPRPLTDYLYGPAATEEALTATEIAQPAMLAIGLGVAAVLKNFGILPAISLGHSLGEFTAAVLSGAISAGDAARFVALRGKAMAEIPGDHGAMLAVMAPREEILPYLGDSIVLANYNHPSQSVLSGPTHALHALQAEMTEAGLRARKIPVSHAFHSPLLSPIQPAVDALLQETQLAAPTGMASCIASEAPQTAEAIRSIFLNHATAGVDFVRGLEQTSGAKLYLQLCSGTTLTAFAKGSPVTAGSPVLSVGGEGGFVPLIRSLMWGWVLGQPVLRGGFGEGTASLPPVPRLTESYWAVSDTASTKQVFAAGTETARTETAHTETAHTETAQPEPSIEPATPTNSVRERVLQVIAKVSAFPVDALQPRQKLLEDLGFDSLMLAELNTKLSENFSAFGGIPRSALAASPTIEELIQLVEAPEGPVQLTQPDRPLVAYQLTLLETPLSGLKAGRTAQILEIRSLAALRALAKSGPQDLVIRISGLLKADPEVGAIAGFAKALAREWPARKIILVDGSELEAAQEAEAAERDTEVIYQEGRRFVVGLMPVFLKPATLMGARVLLTGATGWLGKKLIPALQKQGAEVLAIGSRTQAPELPCPYFSVDFSEPTLLKLPDFSPNLILHAAGTLADGPAGQEEAAGARARAIKEAGLLALHQKYPEARIVAIGSYAGRFGNAMQSEYAAANEAMSYAARKIGASVQVWGPWEGSEMVAKIPQAVRQQLKEEGVIFIDPDQGIRALLGGLGATGEVIFGLDLPKTRRVLEQEDFLRPETPWLQDHALPRPDAPEGVPTVPMALVLERASAFGFVQDLTLFAGVVVSEPTAVRWRLEGTRFTVWANGKLAWAATIVPMAPFQARELPTLPLEPAPFDVSSFYAHHTFHGPLLQGILAITGISETGAAGLVSTGQAAAWGMSEWALGPVAIDSAFQLAAVWAKARKNRAGFPVKIASWRQRAVPANTRLSVTLQFTESKADRYTGTVVLQDEKGEVVAIGEGVEAEFRALEESGPSVPEEHWNFARFPAYEDLAQRLEMAEAAGLTSPYFKLIEGCARDTVSIGGKQFIHFSGYNYLGYSGDPAITLKVQKAVAHYGTSMSASRVASGDRPLHRELEQRISKALGVEDAVLFTAGHATNVTTVGHLFGPKDLILHDELIHDSIFQGMKLSGAARRPFPHGDFAALNKALSQLRRHYEKVLVVVEGVYSMDGDLCDLPRLVALKKRHKAFLMVDEAHSFGVVGKHGYGVSEHFNIPGTEIDIWMGTLSKSLASCGGYIAGSKVLVQLLKYTAPGFVYSAAMSAANTAAASAVLEAMEQDSCRVLKLQSNCRYFYRRCTELGLDCGPATGESAVVPIITGNSYHALLLSDALFKAGINVQPILYPAVAENAARLRFFLSALHSEEQLEQTAVRVAGELGRIRTEFP